MRQTGAASRGKPGTEALKLWQTAIDPAAQAN
jgi:hypothetical protein